MSNLTLKQLRYVDALARSGHFGRAARACSVSQPALSMQIRDLEEALGTALFERGHRMVRLTDFGRQFLDRARPLLRGADDLEDFARAARDRLTGTLRLGVIPTIAPYLLPRIIARMNADLPDIELHLRETITSRLVDELLDARLDAALVALPVSEPALEEIELMSENFVLVRHADDSSLPVPDRNGLKTMRLLLLEEGHCFRDQALSFCDLKTAAPREFLEGSSLSTLVQMVASGIGVTLIPEMAVAVETRSADVHLARFADPQPQRTIGLVWRKGSPLAQRLKAVAELIGRAAKAA